MTIIEGEYNARIGEKGARQGGQRHTKDKVIDAEGEKWLKLTTDKDLTIMNANVGDWEKENTHHSYKAMSFIATISKLSGDMIKQFKVGKRTKSDHFPIEITLD